MTTTDDDFRLDPAQVEATFKDCLFETAEEAQEHGIVVEGIVFDAMLNPAKLDEHRELITQMLMELPDQFRKSIGGGWSFLNACEDRHGNLWTGLHQTMSMLFILGIGIDLVTCTLPKNMWPILPGGMPYYRIEV